MVTPISPTHPRPTRWQRHAKLLLATMRHWNADNASMWAASLAFYTMLSLGPLIFLVVALSGLWLGEHAAQEAVMQQIASTVGPQAADAARSLTKAANHENTGLIASVMGFATLLFGASGVFAALQDAMDAIWHVAPRPDAGWAILLRRRFLSLAMVAGVGFLLVVSFLATALFTAIQAWVTQTLPMAWLPALVLDTGLSIGLLTLSFGAMYKVLPDAKLSWRDVWSGAAVTALLFHIGKLAPGRLLRQVACRIGLRGCRQSRVNFDLGLLRRANILLGRRICASPRPKFRSGSATGKTRDGSAGGRS